MDNLVTPWINVHIASYKLFIELVFYVETLTTALVCAWSSQLSSSRVINVGTKNALGVFFSLLFIVFKVTEIIQPKPERNCGEIIYN